MSQGETKANENLRQMKIETRHGKPYQTEKEKC